MNAVEQEIAEALPDVFADTSGVAAASARRDGHVIAQGQRNAHLTSLAGSMRRRGMSVDAMSAALLTQNAQRCNPPLDEQEVRRIATSVGSYTPASDAVITAAPLEFLTIRQLRQRVTARGPRRYLLRGIWPAGDYGVHAAEKKAQKTWNTTDLAVSVASGTPWLGYVPVDDPGGVLMFVGEGGDANTLRRIEAVCEARGVSSDDLAITICTRAPHLKNIEHLAIMAERIAALKPRVVTLDPLYLSARGASGSDLYAMGEMLEEPQIICQDANASLFVVTHFNRKQGNGADRITGAGPAEWGRVLLSASVKSRSTDPTSKSTTVLTEIDIIGGEVPDQTLRVLRRVWADNPDDLNSALHVETTTTDGTAETTPMDGLRLAPAERKLLEALKNADTFTTDDALVDAIKAKHGHGLSRQTVSTALNKLEEMGAVTSKEAGMGRRKLWSVA